MITGIVGILILPWKLLASPEAYIFDWLIGYSALLGPIAGVLIADYWLVRKTELDVADLYRESGRYGAVNPIAMIALAVGIAPNVLGFLHSVHVVDEVPVFFDDIYVYAWFTGVFVAAAVYVLGMRMSPRAST